MTNYMKKIRYLFVLNCIKYFTPNLFEKLKKYSLNSIRIPRPSIIFMKKFFKKQRLIGIEIGVQLGINSESILKELNIKQLYLIDSWLKETYKSYKSKLKSDYCYKYILNKFKKDIRVNILKLDSIIASTLFDNNSIDFIYIDANHEYNSVYNDIEYWYSKIKINGVISGHDIFNCLDVFHAVFDFCMLNNIKMKIEVPDWYFVKTKNFYFKRKRDL